MLYLTRRIQRLAASGLGGTRTTAPPLNRFGWTTSSDRTKRRTISSRTTRIAAAESSPLASARAFSSTQSSTQQPHAGLFSIPELQTPTDFSTLTKEAIQECNQLRTCVAQTVNNDDDDTTSISCARDAVRLLHQLDDISKAVCNVIDAAELCRSVHADPAWRRAAAEAFAQLSDYIAQLNADATLYRALQLVTQSSYYNSSSSSDDELSEEDKRFARLLQAEFERDGIHLTEEQREEVRELQNQITQLESSFNQNLLSSEHPFAVQHSAAVTEVIPLQVLQQMGVTVQTATDEQQQQPPQISLNSNDSQILQTLLKYSPNAALRREVYRAHTTAVPENETVLRELQRARHRLAVRQGFASYAERNLLGRMAGSTAAVDAFLRAAASANAPAYRRDAEALARAKQTVEGGTGTTLEPWDTTFYTGLLTAQDGDLAATVAQYLSKEAALHGMQVLVDRLFGIRMVEEEMAEAERWDRVPGGGQPSPPPPPPPPDDQRLRKFVFSTAEDGRPLGTMFLDLHPRPGKYGHAAHFTVRCGCALQDWSSSNGDGDDEERGSVRYQLPIVALVCNLSPSSGSDGLSHSEVETLFHEFGHVLHSLLSRTKFQHMSGTRAAMDFVETPSHLMEKFVWDPTFLQTALTASPMPDPLVARLRQSRHQFAAIERQNQILYAMFDQQLFGVPVPGRSPRDLFAQLHREHGVPYLPGTHWYTRFGHLVSYGAGYYGYLYSQLLARDLWKTCFAGRGSSLSREAGMLLWDKMLRHGGARDPKIMLRDMLGRAPKVDFSV